MKPKTLSIINFTDSLSLKSRMSLAVSGLFIVFTAIIASITVSYFEQEFRESISDQLLSIATMEADNVDSKLSIAHEALIARAAAIPTEILSDPTKAQRFLDNRAPLKKTFDNVLFLVSKEGRLIAETPYLPNRRGLDLSFRDYYQTTMTTGKPVISSPYFSTHTPDHPAIILTAPIKDKDGKVAAIIAGSIDLLGKNFLKDISQAKIGKTGYLYIFASDRTLIAHPDPTRIMKPAAPAGVNVAFDRAVDGFEGSALTTNSRGVRMIVSFKRMRSTNWTVTAALPLQEAYAPMAKAKQFCIAATIAGTLLILPAVWLLMKRLLNPLQRLVHEVKALPGKQPAERCVRVNSDKEISVLESAFNDMLATLAKQQNALRESEINFRALAENANDGMLIVSEKGNLVYANKRIAEMTGYRVSELLALSLEEIIHPSGIVESLSRHLKTLAGREVQRQHETQLLSKEQSSIPVEISSSRTVWLSEPVVLVIIRDITGRKVAEEKLLAERRLFIGGPTVIFRRKAGENRPVEYVSPNVIFQFGYKPEQFVESGLDYSALVHPDDRERINAELLSLKNSDIPYLEREYRLKRFDGEYRWVYDFTVVQKDSEDRITHYLGYILDITERKNIEEKLAKTEKILARNNPPVSS